MKKVPKTGILVNGSQIAPGDSYAGITPRRPRISNATRSVIAPDTVDEVPTITKVGTFPR
jgi:hypothetical protein